MNSPAQIAKNYVEIGMKKLSLSPAKTFVLAVMAGFFISAAGIASTVAAVSISQASISRLISALIFPAGMSMVLIAGSELFTGNCLLIIPLLEKRARIGRVIRNMVIVYIGNLAGSLLFSVLLTYGGVFSLFDEALATACIDTATLKCTMPFSQALIKGILCNFFVCIAVWMSMGANSVTGKIVGLYFPIMLFVLSGYEHCVANMGYIANGLFAASYYGIEAASVTWGGFFINNLLPVTLGNIIGGVAIGLAYWFTYLWQGREK